MASSAVLAGLAASYAERAGIPGATGGSDCSVGGVGDHLYVVVGLGRRTIDALLDATGGVARGDEAELERDLMAIDGVLAVERMRTRRSGPSLLADLTLGLSRNLTFQRTEQITTEATAVMERHLPGADGVVHTVPMAPLAESVHDRIRAVAARRNLTTHDVTVQQFGKELHVEQHLEVNERMPLRQA
jgi:divalent metal cation (Fe/Co/Zn/Cd) transporter